MKNKKIKKKKIESIPKINRRLFKKWSEAVRERAGDTCEFCGKKRGEDNGHGIINKLDSHHMLSRKIKDNPLKFHIENGVLVCPFHHKFGIPSFHRDPVTTIDWLLKNRPQSYAFILKNSLFSVSLDNRSVLEEIEKRLDAKEPLDLQKLIEIEKANPRQPKPKLKPIGSLFDEDRESSSSSSD